MIDAQFFETFPIEFVGRGFLFEEILGVFGHVLAANQFFAGNEGHKQMGAIRLQKLLKLQQPLRFVFKVLIEFLGVVYAVVIDAALVVFLDRPWLKDPVVGCDGNAFILFHLRIAEQRPTQLVMEARQRLTEAIVLHEVSLG